MSPRGDLSQRPRRAPRTRLRPAGRACQQRPEQARPQPRSGTHRDAPGPFAARHAGRRATPTGQAQPATAAQFAAQTSWSCAMRRTANPPQAATPCSAGRVTLRLNVTFCDQPRSWRTRRPPDRHDGML